MRAFTAVFAGSLALLGTSLLWAQSPPPEAEPYAEQPGPPPPGSAAPQPGAEQPGPGQPGAEQPGPPPPGSAAPPPGPPRWGQPGYVPPQAAPQGYGSQGYGQPGYGPPGYAQPAGYGPTPGYGPPPPTEPAEPEDKCCSAQIRFDPFDLLFRRLTLEAEVKIWGPITVQVAPGWIFDSPAENLSEHGFDVSANVAWYVQGEAFHGFWLKAHAEYEIFSSTLSNPYELNGAPAGTPEASCNEDSAPGTCTKTVSSMILGAMVGSTVVFGDPVGFAISGGIGIGAALAESLPLEVLGTSDAPGIRTTYYDKTGRIRLLGSLGLGIGF